MKPPKKPHTLTHSRMLFTHHKIFFIFVYFSSVKNKYYAWMRNKFWTAKINKNEMRTTQIAAHCWLQFTTVPSSWDRWALFLCACWFLHNTNTFLRFHISDESCNWLGLTKTHSCSLLLLIFYSMWVMNEVLHAIAERDQDFFLSCHGEYLLPSVLFPIKTNHKFETT